MKIAYMQFKITASRKWKCNKCKKPVYGENGFIHIRCVRDFGYYSGSNDMRICWNCIGNLLKECEEDRKYRQSKYLELTKRAIVRKL